MSGRVLVVGVWGFPGSWRLASYKPPAPPKDVKKWGKLVEWGYGESLKAHSSLAALAKTLHDEERWSLHCVVYGLDTLAAPQYLKLNQIQDDENRRKLGEENNKLIDSFYGEDPRDYREIVDRAERVLKLYVRGYFEEVGVGSGHVSTVILPGVGVFQLKKGQKPTKTYDFRGSPQNALAAMELDLYNRLLKHKPEAVVLDVSHGVNFLPVLAVTALRRAVEVYSAEEGKEVSSAVVNSDPVLGQGQEATMHIVEAGRMGKTPLEVLTGIAVRGQALSREGSKAYKMLVKENPSEELKRLDKLLGKVFENYASLVEAFLKASDYGLALYLGLKLSSVNLEDLRSSVEEAKGSLHRVLKNRSVKVGDGGVTVAHDFSLNTPVILDAIYAADLLTNVVSYANGLFKAVGGYRMAKLDGLKKLAGKIGVKGVAEKLLESELCDVDRRVKLYGEVVGGGLEKPTPYSVVYGAMESRALGLLDEKRRDSLLEELRKKAEAKKCGVNKRDFYAHAGLERNAVAVAVEGNVVLVGYHPRCLDKIDEIVKKA